MFYPCRQLQPRFVVFSLFASQRGSCMGCRSTQPWWGHLCNPSMVWALQLGSRGWSHCWGWGELQALPCLYCVTGKGVFLHRKPFCSVSFWCAVFTWTCWRTCIPSPPVFLSLYRYVSCCSRKFINSLESWACGEGKAGEHRLQKWQQWGGLDWGMLWSAPALLR